jgi:hypothetical protein
MEFILYWLIIAMFVTQIFIPLIKGTQLFPLLKRENKLRQELESEKQHTEEEKIKKQIKKERRK